MFVGRSFRRIGLNVGRRYPNISVSQPFRLAVEMDSNKLMLHASTSWLSVTSGGL